MVGNTAPPMPQPRHAAPAALPYIPTPNDQPWYEKLADAFMPVPADAEGRVSSDDIKRARLQGLMQMGAGISEASGWHPEGMSPSLAEMVFGGVGRGQAAFGQSLDNAAKSADFARQQAAQQRNSEARAAIFAQHAPPPGETPQQAVERLKGMLPEFIRLGDIDVVRALVELLKSQSGSQAAPPNLQAINLGNEMLLRNPVTGEERREPVGQAPSSRAPAAPRLIEAVNPQTGQPEYAHVKEDGSVSFLGAVPPQGTGGSGRVTEGQRRLGVLSQLAEQAAPILDAAQPADRVTSFLGKFGINEGINAQQQQWNQAGMVVADAYLRVTSGANAPEAEVQRVMQMITPQPGDKASTLAQKKATRDTFLKAIRAASNLAPADSTPPDTASGANRIRQYLDRP